MFNTFLLIHRRVKLNLKKKKQSILYSSLNYLNKIFYRVGIEQMILDKREQIMNKGKYQFLRARDFKGFR